jgi:hypothetical protein
MTGNNQTEMRLFDSYKPQLTAGKYRLTAVQTLVLPVKPKPVELKPVEPESVKWTKPKEFWVSAPRFVLAPDEIYSVYPPDGQSGAYCNTIPHVVFASKSLPWERPLSGDKDAPWMAVLLLDEEECTNNTIEVTSRKLNEVTDPGEDIYHPNIKLDPWEEEEPEASDDTSKENEKLCKTIDVPWKLFCEIVPRLGELKYLAHVRKVATGDKEDVSGIGDGGFSLLLGNRVPKKEKQYFAFVVSLEGLSDLIIKTEQPSPPPPSKKVRLVVLSKWSFFSRGEPFEALLKGLVPEDKDAWLRITPPESVKNVKDEKARTALETALEHGYVPVRHHFRHGKSAMSWYRGPLVPLPIPYQPRILDYKSADHALQLDPDVGLFDVSYAAAWQLGRLLALQAPDFARSLFYNETSYVTNKLLEIAADFAVEDENQLLQSELMATIAVEWCS